MSKREKDWIEHLLRRAGFGCTAAELERYKILGFEGTVDELVEVRADNSALEADLDSREIDLSEIGDLRRWWIYRMAFTRRPLEEKLTLFWHGHFATANSKVNNAYLMYQQNQLFREYGFGKFSQLLLRVSKDPAMIVWLDNQQNKKKKPNENFAREIMELFTMGLGNYSEEDVKEAARAFTGWHAPNGFYFNKKQHDFGEKTFLGKTGKFNGEDIVETLSARPETARFLSRKLLTFFVVDEPDEQLVNHTANVYLQNDQNIKEVLRSIFLHPSFRSDKAFHAKIKSPAEFVVGSIKTLEISNSHIDGDLSSIMSRMGQNLFDPPSVKGWDGAMSWIATSTMMERFNFAARITSEKFDGKEGYINVNSFRECGDTPEEIVDHFCTLLLSKDIPEKVRRRLLKYFDNDGTAFQAKTESDRARHETKLRGLIRLVMTLPTFQLA